MAACNTFYGTPCGLLDSWQCFV